MNIALGDIVRAMAIAGLVACNGGDSNDLNLQSVFFKPLSLPTDFCWVADYACLTLYQVDQVQVVDSNGNPVQGQMSCFVRDTLSPDDPQVLVDATQERALITQAYGDPLAILQATVWTDVLVPMEGQRSCADVLAVSAPK